MLIEEVTGRAELVVAALVSTELTFSVPVVLLFLLVVTAAPFKLFIRAEALLRGVVMRFLDGLASTDVSPEPGATLDPRLAAVLMLAGGDAKVDPPDAASVVMDAPCDCDPQLLAFTQAAEVTDGSPRHGEETVLTGLTSLELVSGLFRRPCCCCSSVVVPTGAGSGFPM